MSARFPALRRPTKLQKVTLNAPVKRVLLGEGRQLYRWNPKILWLLWLPGAPI
jgi:hypothetical protein